MLRACVPLAVALMFTFCVACAERVAVLRSLPEAGPEADSAPGHLAEGGLLGGDAAQGGRDASTEDGRVRTLDASPDAARDAAVDAGPALPAPGILYRFDEGAGSRVLDSSGSGKLVHLTIDHPDRVSWLDGALRIDAPTRLVSAEAPAQFIADCVEAGRLTVEAWVVPAAAVVDGTRRIVSLSKGTTTRNFTLGQGALSGQDPADAYVFRVRTTGTDLNGLPMLSTGAGVVQTALTHVVAVRRAGGGVQIFVNGEHVSDDRSGDLSNWDETLRLAIGNENGIAVDRGRQWLGELHWVALYADVMTAEQINALYTAGPDR